jgi:DNA-binding NarL/FixJ family response regulator
VNTRVFLADRQHPFRAGLKAALRTGGFDVVGEAPVAYAAIDEIVDLCPALCMIDGDDAKSLAATARLTARLPDVLMVLLVNQVTPEGLLAAVRAGACGYLPRETAGSSIVRIARTVLAGEYAIPRLALSAVINEIRGDGRQRVAIGGVPVALTAREAQVLDLLSDGRSTQEIAESLEVSQVTVRRHLGSIGGKAGRPVRRLLQPAT